MQIRAHFQPILGKAHQHSLAWNANHESHSSTTSPFFRSFQTNQTSNPCFTLPQPTQRTKNGRSKFPKNRFLITHSSTTMMKNYPSQPFQKFFGRQRGKNMTELPDVGGRRQRRRRNVGGPGSMAAEVYHRFADISGSGPGRQCPTGPSV